MEIIGPHEFLLGQEGSIAEIAEGRGDFGLFIEGETIGFATLRLVEGGADTEQKVMGFLHGIEFGDAKDATVLEGFEILAAEESGGKPLHGVDIAKSAVAVFDIGFEKINGSSEFIPSFGGSSHDSINEPAAALAAESRKNSPVEFARGVTVAGHPADAAHTGGGIEVGTYGFQRFGHGFGGMACLHILEIPEQVEHAFDEGLLDGLRLVGEKKQEVDVGEGVHLASAIAALSADGEASGILG
jgi:hypothetical protein